MPGPMELSVCRRRSSARGPTAEQMVLRSAQSVLERLAAPEVAEFEEPHGRFYAQAGALPDTRNHTT